MGLQRVSRAAIPAPCGNRCAVRETGWRRPSGPLRRRPVKKGAEQENPRLSSEETRGAVAGGKGRHRAVSSNRGKALTRQLDQSLPDDFSTAPKDICSSGVLREIMIPAGSREKNPTSAEAEAPALCYNV